MELIFLWSDVWSDDIVLLIKIPKSRGLYEVLIPDSKVDDSSWYKTKKYLSPCEVYGMRIRDIHTNSSGSAISIYNRLLDSSQNVFFMIVTYWFDTY